MCMTCCAPEWHSRRWSSPTVHNGRCAPAHSKNLWTAQMTAAATQPIEKWLCGDHLDRRRTPVARRRCFMSTCQCCGQTISSPAGRPATSRAIWVDRELLECCNQAYEDAATESVAEVSVAHLLHVIVTHRTYRSSLAAFDLPPSLLVMATRDALAHAPRASHWGNLRTSNDLRTLIERAQRLRCAGEDRAVTLDDCLQTLLYDCQDLACGRQMAQWRIEMRHHTARGSHASASEFESAPRRSTTLCTQPLSIGTFCASTTCPHSLRCRSPRPRRRP